MTTRRRSTLAVVLGIMAVMLAPVHAAAYDANANRPDPTSMRFILPDLDPLVDGRMIGPFDDLPLIPQRAMEHPREWTDFAVATAVFVCGFFPACRAAGGAAGYGYYLATQTTLGMHGRTHHHQNACETRIHNDPMANVDPNDCYR